MQQFPHVHVENIKAAVNRKVASTLIKKSRLKLVDKPFCALCVMCRPEDGDLLLKHVAINGNFDVLLTVHLSIFISVINQLDARNFCFKISLFHASTCFEHMCSSSGGQNCFTQPLVSSHI